MRFTNAHNVRWGTNGILPRPGAASFKRLLDSCDTITPNMQRAEQHPAGGGHIPNRPIKRGVVGLRRMVESTDLANELKRRVVKLSVRRSVVRVAQPLDVPTHYSLPCL